MVEAGVSDAETTADGEMSGREKHSVVVVVEPADAPCVTATEEAQEGRAALLRLME